MLLGGSEAHLTKTEFRLLCELAENRGQGVQPRGAARQGLGLRLLRRRSPGRRAHPPPAHEGRGRPGRTAPRRDGARARLPPGVRDRDAADIATGRRRHVRPPVAARRPSVAASAAATDRSRPPGLAAPVPAPRGGSACAGASCSSSRSASLGAVGVPRRHDVRARALEPHRAARVGQPRGGVPQRPDRAVGAARRPRRAPSRPSDRLAELGVRAPLIRYHDEWSLGVGAVRPEAIPSALRERVLDDGEPAWMIDRGRRRAGHRRSASRCPSVGAYFEFFELDDDEQTLSNVALSLLLAGVITTALGVLLGVFAARRAVRPVGRCRPGGQGDRRRPPRHPPAADRRPRPRRAGQLVQRHGRRRCSCASSATPASPPTSATSCARR